MSRQKNIVARHGEQLVFNNQILKASLMESTKAVYSLANRAYFFEGQMYKGSPAVSVGDYFTRPADNNNTYFIETILNEPMASDMIYAACIRCNVTITIKRRPNNERDDNGELLPYAVVHENVKCFRDISTRSNKATSDGLLDQTIFSLILPHSYMISEGDMVVMKYNVEGQEKDAEFSVESVGSQVIGTDTAQLLFKKS